MIRRLDAAEARILGALLEKEITTPDNYPLSLNALLNACNQKTSREPVMELDESAARQALHSLQELELVRGRGDSRVGKYEHRMQEVFNFTRAETAVICLLLLRGAQTVGELRGRAERMFSFEDLALVQSTLQRLMERDPRLVEMLPRQAGTKEARYVQLLSHPAVEAAATARTVPSAEAIPAAAGFEERVVEVERQTGELRIALDELRIQLDELRRRVVGN